VAAAAPVTSSATSKYGRRRDSRDFIVDSSLVVARSRQYRPPRAMWTSQGPARNRRSWRGRHASIPTPRRSATDRPIAGRIGHRMTRCGARRRVTALATFPAAAMNL
jgi:hypothetical protein